MPTDPFQTLTTAALATRTDETGQALTLAIPPVRSRPSGDAGLSRAALVEGTGPHLSSETHALRQVRLRAATTFLFVAVGIFLAWRLSFGAVRDLWALNVAVMSGLGGLLIMLCDTRPMPSKRLKAIEIAIFGLMAVFFAVRQSFGIIHAGQEAGSMLLAASRGALIGSIILMFVYAMLIPNTWRDAARVVLPIAALPIVTIVAVSIVRPEIGRSLIEATTVELMTENVLYALVASALAIYGVHVINALRVEAFEAKQLNQYRLLSLLGAGGMGDVYLAEHRLMKRPCALKLIRPEKANDPRSLARFELEVQATSRLSHPNTIEIYDYGQTEDGTFYYVMEFLPGLSLQELIERHGPMPPGRVIHLLRQACGALAEAHASGLIHRDLKPANIFAARRGGRFDVTKLLDFGLVKSVARGDADSSVSRENTVQGTPLYMAPEQATGRPDIDHRIDLYAMGGVAYTLLTGKPPFERDSRVAVMAAHAHDPVVPPSNHRADVPDDLEQVVLRCLSKTPRDRPADAESLDRALAACASASDWDSRRAEFWWREFEPGTEGRRRPA